jgi:peptide/nickel transport system permease protein
MSRAAAIEPPSAEPGPLARAWRSFRITAGNIARTRHGAAGCAILVMLALVAAFAPLIAPYAPLQQAQASLSPPSLENLFGTDNTGRDIFSLVIYGTRTSLAIGLGAALGALIVGGAVGMLAGYFRGVVESVLMRVVELFQTLPVIVLVLFTVALFGSSFWLLLVAVILAIWPLQARLVYGQYIRLRGMDFVAAAKVADLSTAHIMLREILPSAIQPVIVQVALDASVAILIEAGLGFLGLSDPNMVSWGQILHVAQDYMTVAWWTSLFPGAAICLAVVGLNLFADGLNQVVDPRMRGRLAGLQS